LARLDATWNGHAGRAGVADSLRIAEPRTLKAESPPHGRACEPLWMLQPDNCQHPTIEPDLATPKTGRLVCVPAFELPGLGQTEESPRFVP